MADQSLADSLRRVIRNFGPISVQQFMGESNARYYAARDPLGAAGDFVTAPEISQMFGEMIGLWCADLWQRAGVPGPLRYVELGPGRGTLAADALRVLARQGLAAEVHFVEASPALGAVQARTIGAASWHADLSTLPDDGPLLIVGNEFLDALPIRQLIRRAGGWQERHVRDGAFHELPLQDWPAGHPLPDAPEADDAQRELFQSDQRPLPEAPVGAARPRAFRHAPAVMPGAVRQLQQDHLLMHRLWQSLRGALARIASGQEADFSHEDLTVLHRFTGLYASHIELEESVIYPASRALLGAPQLQAMGEEMAGRRRAP